MPSQSYTYTSVLLGSAALCLVLAVRGPHIYTRKPFGPKMCQQLCNRISGCSRYKFRTSDLSCQMKNVTSKQQDIAQGVHVLQATKGKEKMEAEETMNCSLWGQIFYTRKHNIQCKPIEGSSRHRKAGRQEMMTRLLLLPCNPSRPEQARQLFLNNNSAADYPFITTGCGMTAAYIPSFRKLVVAYWHPDKIVLASVDDKNETVINTNTSVAGIAVDDMKQIIFMTTITLPIGISVMTTEGKNFTSLVTLKCLPGMIAADHKHSVIYVPCLKKKILRFTYKGDVIGPIVVNNNLDVIMSIDHEDGALYYIETLGSVTFDIPFKISLSENTTKQFLAMEKISDMLTFSNKMYVFRDLSVSLSIYNTSDNEMKLITDNLTVGFKWAQQAHMCLIP